MRLWYVTHADKRVVEDRKTSVLAFSAQGAMKTVWPNVDDFTLFSGDFNTTGVAYDVNGRQLGRVEHYDFAGV